MIKKFPIFSFILLSFSITWISLLPIIFGSLSQDWHFLGSFGPTLAAVYILRKSKQGSGIKHLLNKIKLQFTPFFILASLSPLFLLFIALIITDNTISHTFLSLKVGETNIFLWFLPLISYGVLEEIGWRGFLLPKLQEKFKPLMATFVLTLIWGAWHIPMFFYRFELSPLMVVGFFVSLFFGAVILTYIYNATKGDLLAVIIWHTLWNIVATIDQNTLTPIMSSIIMVAAFLILFGIKPFGRMFALPR
jgi:membrane protease YdiL (CAAX protease family)